MRSMEITKRPKGGACQSHNLVVESKDASAHFTVKAVFSRCLDCMGLTWFRSSPFVARVAQSFYTTIEHSQECGDVAGTVRNVLDRNCLRSETNSVDGVQNVCNRGKGFHFGILLFGHFMAENLFSNLFIMKDANTTTYEVYTVVDLGKDKKPFWQQIGAAFVNKDGSLGVKLNSLPVNGTMNIRKKKSQKVEAGAEAKAEAKVAAAEKTHVESAA